MSQPLLQVENVETYYGNIRALGGVTVTANPGEIVTLIGANGAGKSTTLRSITGLVTPSSGDVLFEGRRLNGTATHEITKLGISMVPEGRAIFANLTVMENLEMGAYLQKDKPGNAANLDRVFTLFPRLKERRKQLGGTLSGGQQQRDGHEVAEVLTVAVLGDARVAGKINDEAVLPSDLARQNLAKNVLHALGAGLTIVDLDDFLESQGPKRVGDGFCAGD